MSNKHRGEVSRRIEIDGEDREYRFRLTTNEWCELEDHFDTTTGALLKRWSEMVQTEDLDMRFIRAFFHAGLRHERPDMTLADAGEIMGAFGLVEAATVLGEAINASMPEQPEGGDRPSPKAGTPSSGKKLPNGSSKSDTPKRSSGA